MCHFFEEKSKLVEEYLFIEYIKLEICCDHRVVENRIDKLGYILTEKCNGSNYTKLNFKLNF